MWPELRNDDDAPELTGSRAGGGAPSSRAPEIGEEGPGCPRDRDDGTGPGLAKPGKGEGGPGRTPPEGENGEPETA